MALEFQTTFNLSVNKRACLAVLVEMFAFILSRLFHKILVMYILSYWMLWIIIFLCWYGFSLAKEYEDWEKLQKGNTILTAKNLQVCGPVALQHSHRTGCPTNPFQRVTVSLDLLGCKWNKQAKAGNRHDAGKHFSHQCLKMAKMSKLCLAGICSSTGTSLIILRIPYVSG